MSENIPQFGELAPQQQQPTYPPYTIGADHYQAQPPLIQKRGMGIASLMIAIAVFIISIIWAAANGVAAGSLLDPGSSFEEGFTAGAEIGSTPEGAVFGLGILFHLVVGTLLGVGALVLGIVAIAMKRGRAQGVAAVVIAVLAPAISYVVYSVAAAATAL